LYRYSEFTKHSKGPVHYDWYLALLNDVVGLCTS
jgi:hypothetical protein